MYGSQKSHYPWLKCHKNEEKLTMTMFWEITVESKLLNQSQWSWYHSFQKAMFYLMKSKFAIFFNIKVTKIERSTFWGTPGIFLKNQDTHMDWELAGVFSQHLSSISQRLAPPPSSSSSSPPPWLSPPLSDSFPGSPFQPSYSPSTVCSSPERSRKARKDWQGRQFDFAITHISHRPQPEYYTRD